MGLFGSLFEKKSCDICGKELGLLGKRKLEDGYELSLKSRYDPAERKKVNDLDRFLNQAEKNEGLEEFFWQLAGVSGLGQDSELHLIGQMVDCRRLEIGTDTVELTLFKRRE